MKSRLTVLPSDVIDAIQRLENRLIDQEIEVDQCRKDLQCAQAERDLRRADLYRAEAEVDHRRADLDRAEAARTRCAHELAALLADVAVQMVSRDV